MGLFKLISNSEYFKNYISFSLMFFFMNNFLVANACENNFLIRNWQEENKLNEFYALNAITYSEHDKLDSQLKMFFGFDPQNPETSFYADLSIIDDSDSILFKMHSHTALEDSSDFKIDGSGNVTIGCIFSVCKKK